MVAGGLRALRQHDLKLLLAFGTVSQLGFMVVLLGSAPRPWWPGARSSWPTACSRPPCSWCGHHRAPGRDPGPAPPAPLGAAWRPVSAVTAVSAASMAGRAADLRLHRQGGGLRRPGRRAVLVVGPGPRPGGGRIDAHGRLQPVLRLGRSAGPGPGSGRRLRPAARPPPGPPSWPRRCCWRRRPWCWGWRPPWSTGGRAAPPGPRPGRRAGPPGPVARAQPASRCRRWPSPAAPPCSPPGGGWRRSWPGGRRPAGRRPTARCCRAVNAGGDRVTAVVQNGSCPPTPASS